MILRSFVSAVAVSGSLSLISGLALARGGGLDPFKTEVDCLGTYVAGDRVSYTIAIEDRVSQTHDIDYTFELLVPGRAPVVLAAGAYTIGVDEESLFNRTLRLPSTAPSGRYSLRITGESATWLSEDTCSFHVN